MYKVVASVFSIVILFFILTGMVMKDPKSDGGGFQKSVNKITNQYAKQVKEKYGLSLQARGGQMARGIDKFIVYLASRVSLSVESARYLEINTIEDFLKMVNSNKDIRPFLNEYPFTSKGVDIVISYKNPNRKQETNKPTLVIHSNNTIHYDVRNPESFGYISIHEEPYEEAYKIVMGHAPGN